MLCDFQPHADAPDKAGGVYKQTVGDTGLEHSTESSGGNGHGTQSAAESAALDAREAPLSFGTVAAHADESVRGDEVALWISGGRAGRLKDWLSLLKPGVAPR